MAEFNVILTAENEQLLKKLAAKAGRSPQQLLQFHVDSWLESMATTEMQSEEKTMVELAPGEYLAPEGMFPDDGCTHTFVERSSNQRCAEDYMTPEQRLDAFAEILATIALRSIRKENQQKDCENEAQAVRESEILPQKAKPKRRAKPKNQNG